MLPFFALRKSTHTKGVPLARASGGVQQLSVRSTDLLRSAIGSVLTHGNVIKKEVNILKKILASLIASAFLLSGTAIAATPVAKTTHKAVKAVKAVKPVKSVAKGAVKAVKSTKKVVKKTADKVKPAKKTVKAAKKATKVAKKATKPAKKAVKKMADKVKPAKKIAKKVTKATKVAKPVKAAKTAKKKTGK